MRNVFSFLSFSFPSSSLRFVFVVYTHRRPPSPIFKKKKRPPATLGRSIAPLFLSPLSPPHPPTPPHPTPQKKQITPPSSPLPLAAGATA